MNAERLLKVATEIISDIKTNNIISLLSDFNQRFSQIVAAPGQQQYQANFIAARDALFKALDNSAINNLNPMDYQIIVEIGGDGLIGKHFKQRIYDVEKQESLNITPSVAYNNFGKIYEEFNKFYKSLEQLVNIFSNFGIKRDKQLDGNQAELSILIPRNVINGDLKKFETDIKIFRDFLDVVQEVSGESYKIEKIASSDFELYILSGLMYASCVAQALNPILDMFIKIMEIREHSKRLKDSGVPDETLRPLQDYERQMIDSTIKTSQQSLLQRCKDDGRRNELAIRTQKTLDTMVRKFNDGYQVVVSLTEEQTDDPDAETDQNVVNAELRDSLNTLNSNLSRVCSAIETNGNILQLPEVQDEVEDTGKKTKTKK